MSIKYSHFLFLLLFAASNAVAEEFWVRPKNSFSCSGLCTGLSYASAFNGLSTITWGAGVGKVSPGDTLHVCGAFDRTTEGTTNLLDLTVSGSASSKITITGSCPEGSPGSLWAARRIDVGAWTSIGNGVYSTPWYYTTEYAAEGAVGEEVLLVSAASLVECQATEGSIYRDVANNFLYYNPTNDATTVWANWTSAIDFQGNDHYVVTNLKLRGGTSGEHGVLELTGNSSFGEAEGIEVKNNDIAFAVMQLVECYDGCDNLLLENNVMHDAPTATYLCRGPVTCSNVTMRGNEVYSGRDLANVYYADEADRHALGGQSITESLFENNHIHDWAGDGLHVWVKDGQYGKNNVVRNNLFEDLADDANANYHRGVALGGANTAGKGNFTSGWKIYNNVFRNLSGGLGTLDEGAAIRVKSQIDTSGNSIEVFNNTIENAHIGIWLREDSLDLTLGGLVHNNAISISPGGTFVKVDPSGDGSHITVSFDSNNYYGTGVLDYRGSAGSLSAWRSALGACPGTENDCASTEVSPTLEALADRGVAQAARTADFDGASIRGPHDIGAYEFTPTSSVTTEELDISGDARIYGDGLFRYLSAPSGTTIKLLIDPESGLIAQFLDVDVTSWTSDLKTWTETSTTITGDVAHVVCDLSPGTAYVREITHEGEADVDRVVANAEGCHAFDYIGGYSTVEFSLAAEMPYAGEVSVSWSNGCRLSWPASTGNDGYQLSINGVLSRVASSVTSGACNQFPMVSGTNAVKVRAYKRDAYSPWSETLEFYYE